MTRKTFFHLVLGFAHLLIFAFATALGYFIAHDVQYTHKFDIGFVLIIVITIFGEYKTLSMHKEAY